MAGKSSALQDRATLQCYEDFFLSVFSGAKKRLDIEVSAALSVLCVEALKAHRTRRSSFS